MFNLFRRQKPPIFQGIYIDGNLYSRSGSDIAVRYSCAGKAEICEAGHVAPNGVTIAQIAYAIALIEGMITVTHNPYERGLGSMGKLGMN